MTTIRTVRLDMAPPLLDHDPQLVWISEDQVLIGHGEALRVPAGVGKDRFTTSSEQFASWADSCEISDEVDLPGTGIAGFASYTFDDRASGSLLVVPEITLGRHKDTWFVTTVDGANPAHLYATRPNRQNSPDRPRFAGASIPDVLWIEAVAEVIKRIKLGEAEKVVLARDFALWSRTPFDTRRMLGRLIERFPLCYTFLVDGLVGASPELLVRTDGVTVESVALAGTIGRSEDPMEDERLGKQLLASEKDVFEHRLAATSVDRVLRSVTTDLQRDSEPRLRRLDNVQHLATAFSGQLSGEHSAIELAALLHPTAAVGGDPTDVAVELIRALEGMDRGRYAGPVGWMDNSGAGEFAIALRCAEISGARARLFTGAGIMSDSLPEKELEETRLKLDAMMKALD